MISWEVWGVKLVFLQVVEAQVDSRLELPTDSVTTFVMVGITINRHACNARFDRDVSNLARCGMARIVV